MVEESPTYRKHNALSSEAAAEEITAVKDEWMNKYFEIET